MISENKEALQNEARTLVDLARKSALNKEYDKAIELYKRAGLMLMKIVKESDNHQQNAVIKKVIAKLLEEAKQADQLRKDPETNQANDKESDQINQDKIVPDIKKDQNSFQSKWYPDAAMSWITRIQEVEKHIIDPIPDIRLDDIASLGESAKRTLKESVIFPFLYPKLFAGNRYPVQRILLTGPCSEKTQIIQALANESKAKLLILPASELFSIQSHNRGERIMKIIFQMGNHNAPSIIYMDGFETIATGIRQDDDEELKRRIKTEFLVQCQTFNSFEVENEKTKEKEWKPFLFIGGSDYPWEMDGAMLRRFDKKISLGLNEEDRPKIFQRYLQELNAQLAEDINWDHLTKRTECYSQDDIASVCREAVMISRRVEINKLEQLHKEIGEVNKNAVEGSIVKQCHLVEALKRIRRSVLDSDLVRYKTWAEDRL